MISEGSCDTEDWSNDAENLALQITSIYYLQYFSSNKHSYSEHLAASASIVFAIIIIIKHFNFYSWTLRFKTWLSKSLLLFSLR